MHRHHKHNQSGKEGETKVGHNGQDFDIKQETVARSWVAGSIVQHSRSISRLYDAQYGFDGQQ